MKRYEIKIGAEYRSQSQRGGRPMVINIPAGTVGEKHDHHGSEVIFPSLKRNGHMPFVWWSRFGKHLEEVPD